MKCLTIVLHLLVGIVCSSNLFSQVEASSKRVLFLGNSYTGVNNLPKLTADIAESMGDTLLFEQNTPGGYTLERHSTNATSLSMIDQGGWDYVVLQEQSQRPSFPLSQVQSGVFPYAQRLSSRITNADSCGGTMFYMTWGRKNGDNSNCQTWPPVCTYEGMDSLLRLRYTMMADQNEALIAPVGPVWRYLRTNHPEIELYANDGSHPSQAGTYAAACTFYTVLFGRDPVTIPFTYTLDEQTANAIQRGVRVVVSDSLETWNVGKYVLEAGFSYRVEEDSIVRFFNESKNSLKYIWDFGDGTTSGLTEPIHTYRGSQAYNVRLIALSCGKADTVAKVIDLSTTDVTSNDHGEMRRDGIISVGEGTLCMSLCETIKCGDVVRMSIYDSVGKLVWDGVEEISRRTCVDIEDLPGGPYFVRIDGQSVYHLKFFKGE